MDIEDGLLGFSHSQSIYLVFTEWLRVSIGLPSFLRLVTGRTEFYWVLLSVLSTLKMVYWVFLNSQPIYLVSDS